MNKLFVPFDFSVFAENALQYAVSMAQRIEASVTVFHIMQVPIPAGYEDASLTYNMAIATKEKQSLQKEITKVLLSYQESYYVGTSNPVTFDVEIRQSKLGLGIKEYMKHHPHQLIIMGTKGMQGWEDMFEESNTATLSNQIDAPILVVPAQATFTGISQMVYASNFDAKDLRLLQEVSEFNELFEGRVICLHVAKDSEEALTARKRMDVLANAAKKHDLENVKFDVVVNKDVEVGLFDYAKAAEVDLLIAKPQEHGVIGSLFHKSLTRQLIHHTDLPLLVIK